MIYFFCEIGSEQIGMDDILKNKHERLSTKKEDLKITNMNCRSFYDDLNATIKISVH